MKVQLSNGEYQECYTVSEFPYKSLKRATCRGKGKYSVQYNKDYMTFDSETSHIDHDIAWIYQWSAYIGGYCVIGRYVSEFIQFINNIRNELDIHAKKKLVIYIHNMAYDMTYLYQHLVEDMGEPDNMLALSPHKFLSINFNGIEFRCSYLLTHRSLANWCEKMNTDVKKMVGAVDYNVVRFPDQELEEVDWQYQVCDVVSQSQCLAKQMSAYHDNIASIPLTSTGYIRRKCRTKCTSTPGYRDWFLKNRMTERVYQFVHSAFGGGLAVCNRYQCNKTIYAKVGHFDFKSHYPSCQQIYYYPDKFVLLGTNLDIDTVYKYMKDHCMLMYVVFNNLHIKKGITCPYISESKCYGSGRVESANGRLLHYEGKVGMYLTEIDYKWVVNQYDTDGAVFVETYVAHRVHFPQPLLNIIDELFIQKETSKGVERDLVKALINAIYGMSATNPVRKELVLDSESMEWLLDPITDEQALDNFYKSRNSFMPYQMGLYVTAHARNCLMSFIADVVGYENFLYCDTDSIFFIDKPEIREKIESYNNKRKESNQFVTLPDGKKVFYGLFEDEEDHIVTFRMLHSKCYAYINEAGELHATIAGVKHDNGKIGAEHMTREQELKSIDNLKDDYTFTECGGTSAFYIQDVPRVLTYEGHRLEIASACVIDQVTKTLNSFNWHEDFVDYN